MNWNDASPEELEELVLLAYAEGIEQETPRGEIIDAILNKAGKRWREASSYIPRMEFDEGDELYGCQSNDYGDVVDPITLEEIPRDKLISFFEGTKKWCFNIDSLLEYAERGRFENPLTRAQLPPEVIQRLQNYKTEKLVHITVLDEDEERELSFDFIEGYPLVEAVVEVFRVLSRALNYRESTVDLLAVYRLHRRREFLDFEEPLATDVRLYIQRAGKTSTDLSYFRALCFALRKRYTLNSFLYKVEAKYHELLLLFAPKMNFMELTRNISGESGLTLLLPFPKLAKGYLKALGTEVPREVKPLSLDVFLNLEVPQAKSTQVRKFLSWCCARILNSTVDKKLLQKAIRVQLEIGETPAFTQAARHLSFAEVASVYKEYPERMILAKPPREFVESDFFVEALGEQKADVVRAVRHFLSTGEAGAFPSEVLAATFKLIPTAEYFEAIRSHVNLRDLYGTIASQSLEKIWASLPKEDKVRIYITNGYLPEDDVYPPVEFFRELDLLLTEGVEVHANAFIPYIEEMKALEKYASSANKSVVLSLFHSMAEYLDSDNFEEYSPAIKNLLRNEHLTRESKLLLISYLLQQSRVKKVYDLLSAADVIDVYDPENKAIPKPALLIAVLEELSTADMPRFRLGVEKGLISDYQIYSVFVNSENLELVELLSSTYLGLVNPELVFSTLSEKYGLNPPKESRIYREIRGDADLQRSFIKYCQKHNLLPQVYSIFSEIGVLELTSNFARDLLELRTDWNANSNAYSKLLALIRPTPRDKPPEAADSTNEEEFDEALSEDESIELANYTSEGESEGLTEEESEEM